MFVLKDIKTNNNISLEKNDSKPQQFETELRDSFSIKGFINAKTMINHIADLLKDRVELNPLLGSNYYDVNIALKRGNSTDEWIALLKQEGIYIEKERKKVIFISIRKK